ncbi:MAG: N-acetyl-gamma-glutamyl-phosphate reductase [Armatimonadetes bacterium]|nr:N-acetyl-gamma-glutamyl-phosphate reductase [Armatimonadota bacterium]
MTKRINVGIVGASGYAGGELLRILADHPQVRITVITSDTYAGQPVASSFPGLARKRLAAFTAYDQSKISQCDLVFLARDSGVAMKVAPQLLNAGVKVIDLSADFRLRDVNTYHQWYGIHHSEPDLCQEAVYGLPELFASRISSARLVANPGCYPTGAILALAPLLSHHLVESKTIIVDAKSGFSGAGRSKFGQDYHFAEVNESTAAYKVAVHRHTPEIEQICSEVAGRELVVSFTPHLIPITRGILSTCYATLLRPHSDEELQQIYSRFYDEAPFVRVVSNLPATKHVAGSNDCHIGLKTDLRTGRVVVISVIDNMVKGAAGQAVQNMNLMYGFGETAGLESGSIFP